MPVAANKSRFDNRARTCCLSPASGASLRRDCGRGGRPDARGRDARVRQPVDPVVGSISLALTDGGTYWTLVPAVIISPPMPGTLAALVAFVAEHQRCGDLDGG